jgi:hypothetical protein
MFNPKVLLQALNYFGIVTANLGMLIFIPQIIKSLGTFSNMTVGWLTMIPYIAAGSAWSCGAVFTITCKSTDGTFWSPVWCRQLAWSSRA